MAATAEVNGKRMEYVEGWVRTYKVPWREVYTYTAGSWLRETLWCLLAVNVLSSTAAGRRWLRQRSQ